MKCQRCGDEITLNDLYWEGKRTGGECPAADVTVEELTADADMVMNGHVPEEVNDDNASETLSNVPNPGPHPAEEKPALDEPVEVGEPAFTENERSDRTWTCDEEHCLEPVRDFVRLALQSMSGSMIIEVRLCDLHLATVELSNTGQYLYIKQRQH